MKYTKLGNSGTVVSRMALGTMYFGDETPEAESLAILDAFVEAGGTHLDTSDVYAMGSSEEIIGKWFATRPQEITDTVVLASKGRMGDPGRGNDLGLSRRHLHRALEGSLRRLGRETIDLYQLHASDLTTPMEETIGFLADAVRAGKIHYVGLSNFSGWELQRFVSTAEAMGAPVPVSHQPQYSLLSRWVEWEVLPAAISNGLAILPWSPLASGFLTGKYKRGDKPAPDTRAGSEKPLYQWTSSDYAKSDQNWAVIDAVVRIASDFGVPPSHVALSWLANRPGVTAPIVGARTVAHLTENIGFVDLELDAETTQKLDRLSAPVAPGYPYDDFGQGQRARCVEGSDLQPQQPYENGAADTTGRG
jgi:aryl-alcohol dehydrogenase-like predicted oxidoreductase